jgi:hypothetical protein
MESTTSADPLAAIDFDLERKINSTYYRFASTQIYRPELCRKYGFRL